MNQTGDEALFGDVFDSLVKQSGYASPQALCRHTNALHARLFGATRASNDRAHRNDEAPYSTSTAKSWRHLDHGPKRSEMLYGFCVSLARTGKVDVGDIERLLAVTDRPLASVALHADSRTDEGTFARLLADWVDSTRPMVDIVEEEIGRRNDGVVMDLSLSSRADPYHLSALRLLGIGIGQNAGHTAIVLPTFDAPNDVVAMRDVRNDGHALHDVRAAWDVNTSIGFNGGARQPALLLSADRFVEQLLELPKTGNMTFAGHGRGEVEVSSFVIIGLFSSPATKALCKFANNKAAWTGSPIWIEDAESLSDRKLIVRNPVSGEAFRTVSGDMRQGPDARDYAVISRMTFADVTISIIGGFSTLGTAKVGDYITRLGSYWTPELVELAADPDRDFVTLLKTPPSGVRFDESLFEHHSNGAVKSPMSWPRERGRSLASVVSSIKRQGETRPGL